MTGYPLLTAAFCLGLLGACAADRHVDESEGTDGPVSASINKAVLRIAGDGPAGGPEFQGPVDATRLSSGGVVVVDQQRPGVLFFDHNGNFVRTVEGQGEGPGEFIAPIKVCRYSDDSLYVWDAGLQRMSVLDSSGSYVRSFRLAGGIPPFRIDCGADGRLAVLNRPLTIEAPDPLGRARRRYLGQLWLADAEGRESAVLDDVDVGETRPLGRLTTMALSSDWLYVGTAESSVVDVYTLDGRALPSIRVAVPLREATMHNYEQYIDRAVAQAPTEAGRAQGREMMLQIPKPDWLPYYSEVLSDPEGTLWVVTSAPGDSATVLRVIARDGRLLGDVSLPPEATVMEVGRDYLLTMLEDSDSGERGFAVYDVRIPHRRADTS